MAHRPRQLPCRTDGMGAKLGSHDRSDELQRSSFCEFLRHIPQRRLRAGSLVQASRRREEPASCPTGALVSLSSIPVAHFEAESKQKPRPPVSGEAADDRANELLAPRGQEHRQVRGVHGPVAVQVGRTTGSPCREQDRKIRGVHIAVAIEVGRDARRR